MEDLLHLARLVLEFGRVDRMTRHPDGVSYRARLPWVT